jgi:hypothetical protein
MWSVGSSKDMPRPHCRKRDGRRRAGHPLRERILPYNASTPASVSCAERPYGFLYSAASGFNHSGLPGLRHSCSTSPRSSVAASCYTSCLAS